MTCFSMRRAPYIRQTGLWRGRSSLWLAAALLLWGSGAMAQPHLAKKAAPPEALGWRAVSANGGLEEVQGEAFAGWRPWVLGYEVDETTAHQGRRSARCRSDQAEEQYGISQAIELNQRFPAPVVVQAWSKAEGVSEGRAGGYSLYCDLEYMDGTPLWGQLASFDAGTHDWQQRLVWLRPSKPIRQLVVYGLFRGRTGAVWFDDFMVKEASMLEGVTLFDGVPVVRSGAAAPGPAGPTLESDDGLLLRLDANGRVVTEGVGGFCLRDAAAKSDLVWPRGTVEVRADGSVRFEGQAESLGLALTVTYRSAGVAISMEGEVRDLTGRDRAVTVYFLYPVDALGWQWHDDQGAARTIEAGSKYGHFAEVGAGANGLASRYPLSCISSEQEALALAVPLDQPRLWRLGYDGDTRELYAALDVGLTAETRKFPSRASFSLVIYQAEPAWGFRSALARYYQLFPQCFVKRNQKEGIWMPFTDIATVEGWEDFGFQFKEGDNNVAFDDEHGISSFVYVEPWSLWLRMDPEVPRTHEAARALIAQQAAEGRGEAQAALSSAIEDAEGRWVGQFAVEPWCNGVVYAINCAPGVPPDGPGGVTQFDRQWQSITRAFARSPGLDGTYIDSFEIYMASNALNYRRAHFAEAETPLVFDQEGRVAQSLMFCVVDFAREVARRMWAEGHMTFANGTPYDYPWGAAWLDIMGTEYNWAQEGRFAPPPQGTVNYWRALSYQRPYLLLLNTDFNTFRPEWMELYMRRALASGLFPSMFSHNAADDPYWQNPALYHRDRHLFRRYIPLIATLSAAGWEPVTGARSDRPGVLLERFGRPPGPVYLTAYNNQDQPQRVRLTLELGRLLPSAAAPAVSELLSGEGLTPVVAGDSATVELEIAPQDVKVVAIRGAQG